MSELTNELFKMASGQTPVKIGVLATVASKLESFEQNVSDIAKEIDENAGTDGITVSFGEMIEFISNAKALESRIAEAPTFWVARDKNGSLQLSNCELEQGEINGRECWEPKHPFTVKPARIVEMSRILFPDLKWEHSPIKVRTVKDDNTTTA